MGRWMAMSVVLGLASCASGSPPLDEARAIEIARGEVRARDTWEAKATYRATQEAGRWSVLVQRVEGRTPEGTDLVVPGGHRLILIDAQGRVIDYQRGR